MGLVGKKRSQEHSLSTPGADHSRDAESFPGSASRPEKVGAGITQNTGAGKSRLKRQRSVHALARKPRAIGGKAKYEGWHSDTSGEQHKHAPQQLPDPPHALKPQNSRQAAPMASIANGVLLPPASAEYTPPQRKRRNRNKFKPEPEPVLTLAPQEHAYALAPKKTLPLASGRNATGVGVPTQEPGIVEGMAKKRSKNKFKQNDDAVPAPAQPCHISAAKQQSLQQSNAGGAAGSHMHHMLDAQPGKRPLNTPSLGQPGKPARQKAQKAGVSVPGQGNEHGAHVQQAKASQKGLPDQKHLRKRQKMYEHAQEPKIHDTAPGFRPAAPGKAGNGKAVSGNATAAAKAAVQTVTAPPLPGTSMSANWAALKAQIAPPGSKNRQRKAVEPRDIAKGPEAIAATQGMTPILAVDCEMVGAGPEGARSLLARVCVVNQAGNVLLDEYVAQKERVTDYRTRFSGIRPSNLIGAPSLEEVQAKVAVMIKGRIVVGHSITNDLTALLLSHPRKLIRDTARFPPLMRATAPGRRPKPRALCHLAAQHLGLTIQAGEHSPVDDARAALYLYLRFQKEWEHNIERGTISQLLPPLPGQKGKGKRQRTLEEMAAADPMVDL